MTDLAWFPVTLTDGRLVWLEAGDYWTYLAMRVQQFWGMLA